MDKRVIGWVAAVVTLLGGVGALLMPEQLLPLIGFRVADPVAWSLGEVRATYGGLFVVLGGYAVAAMLDPAANRGRLVMLGLAWWGIAAGRTLGIVWDGGPGMFGWAYLAFELLLGASFVFAGAAGDAAEPSRSAPPVG